MNQFRSLNKSYIRARIIGIILISIGIIFLINPTSLNIKISFIMILLGLFMMFMITEKSISQKISDVQVEGNMDTINKLINELNLHGNAIFIPRTHNLSEERIFIPPNKTGVIQIPNITNQNDNIIISDANGKKIGISIPPAGLKLLKEIEQDKAFQNLRPENIEEKLQLLVGLNLLKSVSFKQDNFGWKLEIEKPSFHSNGHQFHNQYPCPTCSAVITMITRAFNEKIRVYNTTYKHDKITFHLNLIKRRVQKE